MIKKKKPPDILDLNEISTLQKRRKKIKIKREKKVVTNRIVKCKLKTILKNQNWLDHIKNIVKIINMIKTESYFFFNQYILYSLANNKDIKFDKTTIERSTLFVLNMQDSIRYKDDEYYKLEEVYNNSYKILGKNKILEYANIKSVNNPFAYISREIITNIINHINIHFFKFQKLYIKTFVYDEFLKYKFNKSLLCSIISCILYNINNKTDSLIIKSKKLQNNEKLNEIIPNLDLLIKKFKEEIPLSIRENITNSNLKKNYGDVLKYYYKMIKYLEDNDKKRFSLLPQLSLKMSYVKFDSRMISTIYDNFKLKKDKVGIKHFETNYKKFYKECFNFSKFKYSHNGNPISFSTNGYSVCVNFELKKESEEKSEYTNQEDDELLEVKQKEKKKEIIIDFNEINKDKKFKRGLFDSDNCIASSETLDKYHKIGIDPGNKSLLYCVSETGKKIEISKGYYNEISHITVNNLKNKKKIKENNMLEIYNKLADTGYKKTVKLEIYNKYIRVMRDNWDQIYNFYGKNNFQKLELDTFINKKKALHKIVRKLVPKNNKKHNFKEKDKIICSEEEYNEIIKKPVMLVFGKGNGKITINNLKNNGPKGPVKTLAKELSKYGTVMLSDEYNTSQICPICKENKLIHPKINKKYNKTVKIDEVKTKVEATRETENYKLCYCNSNKNHPQNEGYHKVWFCRDYVGGLNQINRMKLVMTKSELGLYKRSKEDTPMKIYWSQDQGRYCTLASKEDKILCELKTKDSKVKNSTTKVKLSKVLHNNEDTSL